MKKIIALLLIAFTVSAFAACSAKQEETQPASSAPTVSPYIATPVDEPEWTYADGVLKLEDSKFIYAEGSDDILCFAIVGADKDDMELRFMLSDEKAAMTKEQGSKDGSYYITFNGEMIGKATLSDDCKIATVTAADAQGDITELATKIRGVG